jgi:hypothetical protein
MEIERRKCCKHCVQYLPISAFITSKVKCKYCVKRAKDKTLQPNEPAPSYYIRDKIIADPVLVAKRRARERLVEQQELELEYEL